MPAPRSATMEQHSNVFRLSPAEARPFPAAGLDARPAVPGPEPGTPEHLSAPAQPSGPQESSRREPEPGSGSAGEAPSTRSGGEQNGAAADSTPAADAVLVAHSAKALEAGVESINEVRSALGLGAAAADAVDQADGFGVDASLRCRDCHRPRHSTPRHAPDCRYAYQNCPGCTSRGAHLASCPLSTQLRRPDDTCCPGVDMPGVGAVHTHECRVQRQVLRASAPYAAPVKPALEASDFAGYAGPFGQLLFAARDLARSRVIGADALTMPRDWCLECDRSVSPDGSGHLEPCRTGRVLDLVARICAIAPDFDFSSRRPCESSSVEEIAGALAARLKNGGAQ
ncbi:hypothetical protein [Occallatibacter riparius]|uniref:Uncharacterized protein n=1 Tax=Occallatibacter riparius TaxID=1002689 RepID=A0A9J7BP11_9BACT|nr:hypothetical protein [Occallatibacter riparius]UWZ84620.1 hypothetical protein MOP44_01495 [Occallatibacter riparius]